MMAPQTLGIQENVRLWRYTTLKTGGPAEFFATAFQLDHLAELALSAQGQGIPVTTLGWGSNVLPSDRGVPGLVLHNATSQIEIDDRRVVADSGVGFQELFLKCLHRGLGGLEYAVGIPGTVGGALVSNAGAYRSNVSEFLTGLEIVHEGTRRWVEPAWMEFEYRDSRLRRPGAPTCTILRIEMLLPAADLKKSYDEARDYQRQRIGKQPPPASAGSFFKNVNDRDLAARLDSLPPRLKEAGVVPAGYLIQEAGLAGARLGGAMLTKRHANFMVNAHGATASDVRSLASFAIEQVEAKFGVRLEEEVLYLGDWSDWVAHAGVQIG